MYLLDVQVLTNCPSQQWLTSRKPSGMGEQHCNEQISAGLWGQGGLTGNPEPWTVNCVFATLCDGPWLDGVEGAHPTGIRQHVARSGPKAETTNEAQDLPIEQPKRSTGKCP